MGATGVLPTTNNEGSTLSRHLLSVYSLASTMLQVGHTADKINQVRDRQGIHRLTGDKELKSTAKQLSMSVIAGCGSNTGKIVKDVRHRSPGAFWAEGKEEGTACGRLSIHFLVEVLKSPCVRLDWEGGASTEVNGQTRKHAVLKTSSRAGTTKELGKGSSN